MVAVEGVGPNEPMVVNASGGVQSKTYYRFDLMDPAAMLALGKLLKTGAEDHGVNNWHYIPTEDHLNKAMIHIVSWLAGNREDDHLVHAFCRLMFAVGIELMGGPKRRKKKHGLPAAD